MLATQGDEESHRPHVGQVVLQFDHGVGVDSLAQAAHEPVHGGRSGRPFAWSGGTPEQRFHLGEFRSQAFVTVHHRP